MSEEIVDTIEDELIGKIDCMKYSNAVYLWQTLIQLDENPPITVYFSDQRSRPVIDDEMRGRLQNFKAIEPDIRKRVASETFELAGNWRMKNSLMAH